ncbi:MAG: oxygen-dependent coproporphyrinogen oxidase [Simkaniaceae bacterium]|nr:oxygen-dependent coproporphyrinogen oxidase [Simkaniaceae bacterium]
MDTIRNKYVSYFKELRENILSAFESLEPTARFERKPWNHTSGGSGEIGLLRGDVFEKAGVNFSAVEGAQFPAQDAEGPFFATGVSLVTHMLSPKMPTVHMNVRMISTPNETWVGGGYDLTPMGMDDDEDKVAFHHVAKEALDSIDVSLYPLFYQNAKEYFYIPHRKRERGVGGIFFDHFHSDHPEKDFELIRIVGDSFLDAIMPIYQKKKDCPFTPEDKEMQLKYRAHYAEFNLVYDRGTKFGFNSGANPEAILVSMPPLAKW